MDKETVDELKLIFGDVREAGEKFRKAVGRLIIPIYKEAGEPYGPTDEGMYRWFFEKLSEIDQ
jgi:hypothetical protein